MTGKTGMSLAIAGRDRRRLTECSME